jgi:hypothetical protein
MWEQLKPENVANRGDRINSNRTFFDALTSWAMSGLGFAAVREVTMLQDRIDLARPGTEGLESIEGAFPGQGEYQAGVLPKSLTLLQQAMGMGVYPRGRSADMTVTAMLSGFMDKEGIEGQQKLFDRLVAPRYFMKRVEEMIGESMGGIDVGFVSGDTGVGSDQMFANWKKILYKEDKSTFTLLFGDEKKGVKGKIKEVSEYWDVTMEDTRLTLQNIDNRLLPRGSGHIFERKVSKIARLIPSMPELVGIINQYNIQQALSTSADVPSDSIFDKWGRDMGEVGATLEAVTKLIKERIGSDQDMDKDYFDNINMLRDKVLSVGVATSLSVWYPLNSGG